MLVLSNKRKDDRGPLFHYMCHPENAAGQLDDHEFNLTGEDDYSQPTLSANSVTAKTHLKWGGLSKKRFQQELTSTRFERH